MTPPPKGSPVTKPLQSWRIQLDHGHFGPRGLQRPSSQAKRSLQCRGREQHLEEARNVSYPKPLDSCPPYINSSSQGCQETKLNLFLPSGERSLRLNIRKLLVVAFLGPLPLVHLQHNFDFLKIISTTSLMLHTSVNTFRFID